MVKSRILVAVTSATISGIVFFAIGGLCGMNVNSDKYYDMSKELELADTKIYELEEKVENAKPWLKMGEKEQQKLLEEQLKSYDTGITYYQLSIAPDYYLEQKMKSEGEVLEVVEGNDTNQLKLAVYGDSDRVMLVEYTGELVDADISEGDYITVRGVSKGLGTYESTSGESIDVPLILANGVDVEDNE